MLSQAQQWFEGVILLGHFNILQTGCWLLVNGTEAAILEMPPRDPGEPSPAEVAAQEVKARGLSVKFLLCTHDHSDHFAQETLDELMRQFPTAIIVLHHGFEQDLARTSRVRWFADQFELSLGGEPLFLLSAPKHSVTDTMVVFRGVICTGDWELRTIRSVHDSWSGITTEQKLASIQRLIDFVTERNYRIHQVFSVHANDRQEGVDFVKLMEQTREDRVFW
jgi:hydroxyacylglutathione hydrolase